MSARIWNHELVNAEAVKDARIAELEAKVARVEALCAGAWFTGEIHRDDIREALAGASDE